MNGNLIDPVPFQRRANAVEEAVEGVSAADCEAILLEITRPRLRRLVSLRLAHPVISLVMWEWWSRDNGTLSLHMRQEDSLRTPNGGRGRRVASCYQAQFQQLPVEHVRFRSLSVITVGGIRAQTRIMTRRFDSEVVVVVVQPWQLSNFVAKFSKHSEPSGDIFFSFFFYRSHKCRDFLCCSRRLLATL